MLKTLQNDLWRKPIYKTEYNLSACVYVFVEGTIAGRR